MHCEILCLGAAAGVVLFWSAIGVAKDAVLTPEQVSRMEIKLEPVRPTSSETIAVLPATVVYPPNSQVVATAPFGGTVTVVHVLPGEQVKKGAILARVSSRDVLEAQSQIAQAEAELRSAEALARRKRTMADKDLQSPTLADEAEAHVARVRAVVERHRRTLALNGIVVGERGEYEIPASCDGIVVEIDVMPGDKVETMGAVVSLDTSKELWAEIQVPADIVSKIKLGDSVRLASGDVGRVLSIGTNLDAKTRSAIMYAQLPNGTKLLPGQMISVTLMRERAVEGYSVPAQSVTHIDNQAIVFVRTVDGFAARPVRLLAKSANVANVTGDLNIDTVVAASGIPQLERLLDGN